MWPLWNSPVSKLQTTLLWCCTIFACTCSALVLCDYRCPLGVLCFGKFFKKLLQNKVTTQTSCFGFFQKAVVFQSLLAHFIYKQFHKAVPWYRKACCTQRSWLSSEKHEGKRLFLFLRTKDEQLSWTLCLTEYGRSLYAKLEHYTQLNERLRLCFVQSAFIFQFFFFPDLKSRHVFKSWKIKSPPIHCL